MQGTAEAPPMTGSRSRVCVTGAAGYIASWLVKKLLDRGHTVHATLRNLGDESKVELLKRLSDGVDHSRLVMFQADMYNSEEYEAAIKGCEFVFLVATPLQHDATSTKYKDTAEATVAAMRCILQLCEQSGTVRRVIYTGSVTAASPLKDDETGFKDFVDESCWTPLHLTFAPCEDHEKFYTLSKTLAEKEILSYNGREKNRGMEVVSLACGLVGGDTLLSYIPGSMRVTISPLICEPLRHRQLKFLQALIGSVPLIHIEDICEAHVFCMEATCISGRFLCASVWPTMHEIVDYFAQNYPEQGLWEGREKSSAVLGS